MLWWDIELLFSREATDGVVAPHHVLQSGVLVMSRGWFVAGHGGMRWVVAQSVQPAPAKLGWKDFGNSCGLLRGVGGKSGLGGRVEEAAFDIGSH